LPTPLQITVRHMAQSDALTARIREDADKLSEFYPRIVNCHVVVEQRDLHKHQGGAFNVRILLRVPGHEIVVTYDHDEDVYVALRDAFAAVTRQLEDYARQQRGDVKTHQVPAGAEVVQPPVGEE
jgi:ribosomal subunit interface protein